MPRLMNGEFGAEWQLDKTSEFTLGYVVTDRTNPAAVSSAGKSSYQQYEGQLIRLQYQVNF